MRNDIAVTYFRASTLVLSALSALLIGTCGFLVDFLVHNTHRLYASDLYTVAIAFAFSYALMIYQARSHANLLRRMEIAAEVNHHIRNALTAVVYTAAVQHNPELETVINDATSRIDWVLSTVLPDGKAELQWPVQSPSWKPSEWSRETQTHSKQPFKIAEDAHLQPEEFATFATQEFTEAQSQNSLIPATPAAPAPKQTSASLTVTPPSASTGTSPATTQASDNASSPTPATTNFPPMRFSNTGPNKIKSTPPEATR